GNDAANVLSGGLGVDQLFGNGGADTLDGGAGADTMFGGAGDDTYYVDNAGDFASEYGGSGVDTVVASLNWGLGASLENLVLTGAAVSGAGNSLDNTITGNANANILDGGAGADTLIGGAGDDVYRVDNAADVIIENAGGGVDNVTATVSYTLSDNVERLSLMGSAAINGTGNGLDNLMNGNGAANVLHGMDGADNLFGNGGADTLYGDAGVDTLQGGDGADTLDGGAGADAMYGGAGNDTYVVDDAGDVTSEYGGGGIDTVLSSVTRSLGAGLENLTLTGSAAISGYGNTLDNVLTGNSGANLLYAVDGADTLAGGAGNDTLFGGAGADDFVFSDFGAANADLVRDFVSGEDHISLDHTVFSALSAGPLSADQFVVGAAAADANDHLIFNSATGALYYDADGAGGADQVLVATLQHGATLTADDILIF
ncbi:MAG TPA: calcium-binding protein, partial [Caulobacterales bacterium]|nr:calcium-binding protein [Caulobacterales bacterium]